MRHQEPFKVMTYPQVVDRLNKASMAIKIHRIHPGELNQKLRDDYPMPTWDDLDEMLLEACQIIQGIKHDPRKY